MGNHSVLLPSTFLFGKIIAKNDKNDTPDALGGWVGPLVRRLQSFGELQTFVVGNWGEGSEDLHALVQTCAEARVAHIC